MSDEDFIKFLWRLLWDDLSDGDTPTDMEWSTLLNELTLRGILDGEFPS